MKEPGEPTAPAARKEHREIQRGRETKAAEGTNQNRAGFNIEKGVGNCKRKREKKKKKGGGWKQRKFLAASCCAWPFSISLLCSRSAGLPRGAGALVLHDTVTWSKMDNKPQLHPQRPCQPCSEDRKSQEKGHAVSDGTQNATEKQQMWDISDAAVISLV